MIHSLSYAVVAAAFIAGAFYYEAEEKRADAVVMTACIEHGGSFYVSWNWKPVCELKGSK